MEGSEGFHLRFQSTLPIKGETTAEMAQKLFENISIHSPYTGRDHIYKIRNHKEEISIHSPYTGRDGKGSDVIT